MYLLDQGGGGEINQTVITILRLNPYYGAQLLYGAQQSRAMLSVRVAAVALEETRAHHCSTQAGGSREVLQHVPGGKNQRAGHCACSLQVDTGRSALEPEQSDNAGCHKVAAENFENK